MEEKFAMINTHRGAAHGRAGVGYLIVNFTLAALALCT